MNVINIILFNYSRQVNHKTSYILKTNFKGHTSIGIGDELPHHIAYNKIKCLETNCYPCILLFMNS